MDKVVTLVQRASNKAGRVGRSAFPPFRARSLSICLIRLPHLLCRRRHRQSPLWSWTSHGQLSDLSQFPSSSAPHCRMRKNGKCSRCRLVCHPIFWNGTAKEISCSIRGGEVENKIMVGSNAGLALKSEF